METDNYNEKIDAYLDGEMAGEELAQFEQLLKTNEKLEKAVKNNLLLREGLLQIDRETKLRNDIRKWRSEVQQQNPPQPTLRPLRTRLAIAASILILIGMATFLWVPTFYTDQHIAATVYENDLPKLKTRSADGENPMQIASLALANENYPEAIANFKLLPQNDRALYGLAHAYYLSGDYDNAAASFRTLQSRNNPEFQERAQWYLLLSLLAGNKASEEAETLLNKVISDGGFYSDQATGIKKKRQSFWRR